MIRVPSEGNDNPIDEVIFYKKPKGKNLPPAVLKVKEVKEMVRKYRLKHVWHDLHIIYGFLVH